MYEDDPEARKLSNELFKLLDNDKSGSLDQKELRRARTILLCRAGQNDEITALTQNFNTNGDVDGDGKVSQDEWHDFVGSMYAVAGKKNFLSLARYWMANSGGQVKASVTPKKKVVGTVGDPEADPDADAREAAARKIQQAARKRQSAKKEKEKKSKADLVNHGPEKLTSIDELWDILLRGKSVTSIEVTDFIDFFITMKSQGLDLELASAVPTVFEDGDFEPEDLSPGEVAHLSLLLLNTPALSDEEARAEIEPIREESRKPENSAMHFLEPDAGAFRQVRMKRWCELIASLMRVELEYVVISLVWQCVEQFELPESITVQLLKLTMTEDAAKEWAKTVSEGGLKDVEANGMLLTRPFGLNELMRFAHRSELIDKNEKVGMSYGHLQGLFARVWKDIPKLMEQRAAVLKWKCTSNFTKDDAGLVGRHEIAILLHEVWKQPQMMKTYGGPLGMTVRLVQRAAKNPRSAGQSRRLSQPSALDEVRGGGWS